MQMSLKFSKNVGNLQLHTERNKNVKIHVQSNCGPLCCIWTSYIHIHTFIMGWEFSISSGKCLVMRGLEYHVVNGA